MQRSLNVKITSASMVIFLKPPDSHLSNLLLLIRISVKSFAAKRYTKVAVRSDMTSDQDVCHMREKSNIVKLVMNYFPMEQLYLNSYSGDLKQKLLPRTFT